MQYLKDTVFSSHTVPFIEVIHSTQLKLSYNHTRYSFPYENYVIQLKLCCPEITDSANRHRATPQFQLLSNPDWDDWAPALTASTKPPVCSRRLAILLSLEKRKRWWGEEGRRGG